MITHRPIDEATTKDAQEWIVYYVGPEADPEGERSMIVGPPGLTERLQYLRDYAEFEYLPEGCRWVEGDEAPAGMKVYQVH